VFSERSQKNGLLFSEFIAQYELTKSALLEMKDSNLQNIDRCPSLRMLLEEVQEGKATEYLVEMSELTPEAAAAKFGMELLEFVKEVANPFLHHLLKGLTETFEESSQILLLAASDLTLLTANLDTIPRSWKAHEDKQAKSKKKLTFRLTKTSSAEHRAFDQSVSTIVEGLGLSKEQATSFKEEHSAWRLLCGARRVQKGLSPIKTIADLSETLRVPSVPPISVAFDPQVEAICPTHCLALSIVHSCALVTAEVERGFSKLARILTDNRNRLTSTQLNNLMLVSAHAPKDPEKVEAFLELAISR
jgi:hypothetical protein